MRSLRLHPATDQISFNKFKIHKKNLSLISFFAECCVSYRCLNLICFPIRVPSHPQTSNMHFEIFNSQRNCAYHQTNEKNTHICQCLTSIQNTHVRTQQRLFYYLLANSVNRLPSQTPNAEDRICFRFHFTTIAVCALHTNTHTHSCASAQSQTVYLLCSNTKMLT